MVRALHWQVASSVQVQECLSAQLVWVPVLVVALQGRRQPLQVSLLVVQMAQRVRAQTVQLAR